MCTGPWIGTLDSFEGMKSAPQYPMAIDRSCWQGEPIVMIVASNRAAAEDAAEAVIVDYEELPVTANKETALDSNTPVIHPNLGDNLAFKKTINAGNVEKA